MKHLNIVVSIIIAAAVLIAAYAVGLLVRHARTQDRQSGPVAVTSGDSPATVQAMLEKQKPGGGRERADANMAAQAKAKKEQMLEKMKNMTEEEKRRFTEEQVRGRLSPIDGRGRVREISPEERQKIMQRWQMLSDEEKKALETQMGISPPAGGQPQPSPDAKGTTTQQKPEQTPEQSPESSPKPGTSEPDKAGKG